MREALRETVGSLEARGFVLWPLRGRVSQLSPGYYYRASWTPVLSYLGAERGVLELRVLCVGEDLEEALGMAQELRGAFLELWPNGEARLAEPVPGGFPGAYVTLRRPA